MLTKLFLGFVLFLATGFGQIILSSGSGVQGSATLTTTAEVTCVSASATIGECNAATSPAITKAVAATSTDGFVLATSTAATVGAQKWSPRFHWSGKGWGTTAGTSQAVDWITELVPVQGLIPTARLDFSYSVAGAAYTRVVSILNGNLGIGTSAPTAELHLSSAAGSAIAIINSAISAGPMLRFNYLEAAGMSLRYSAVGGSESLDIQNNSDAILARFLRTGQLQVNGTVSNGTKFTITGCSAGTTVGGATSGTFVSGTTGTCTVVITMNGATGLTATTGWACTVSDRTTGNLMRQTASSATTATVEGTTVTSDVISFACIGY